MKTRDRQHHPMKTRNIRKITDDPGGTEPSVLFKKNATWSFEKTRGNRGYQPMRTRVRPYHPMKTRNMGKT